MGGEFFLSSLSALKDISGMKALMSVGGNFTIQILDQLADENLDGFSSPEEHRRRPQLLWRSL